MLSHISVKALYIIYVFLFYLSLLLLFFQGSGKKMEFKNIALLITENCNARCKMCCDSRGVVCGKTLSVDEIDYILNNIKDVHEIESVGITGGEPMLYPELVKKILNYDYGRSMSVTLKTNGFLGKNKHKAEEFIRENKNKLS